MPWRESKPEASLSVVLWPTNFPSASSQCVKGATLPNETIGQDYELEYGNDRVEIHRDAISPGEKVLLIDDLLATGGTAIATLNLLRRTGADIVACGFAINLPGLGGLRRLEKEGVPVLTLIEFEDG